MFAAEAPPNGIARGFGAMGIAARESAEASGRRAVKALLAGRAGRSASAILQPLLHGDFKRGGERDFAETGFA